MEISLLKTKTSKLQYFSLFTNLLYGKAIGITAGVVVRAVGADAWTSMLIAFLIGIIFIQLMAHLGSKFPELTMIDYSKLLLGKWVSRFFSILLVIFFAFAYATSANTLTLHIKQYLLPETPTIAIILLYAALVFYGTSLGIEVITRVSFIAFVLIILFNIITIFGTIQDFQAMNLQPIFDKGIIENLKAGIYSFGDLSFVILGLGIIYPILNKKNKAMSTTFWASIFATFIVITWPFIETATLGADVMKQFSVVCMQLIRGVQLTRYFPRSELIMINLFVWSIFVQSSLMLFCCIYTMKDIIKVKKEWHLSAPLTVLIALLTYLMVQDHNKFVEFLAYPWPQAAAILSIGYPSLLFIISLIRKKKIGTNSLTKQENVP